MLVAKHTFYVLWKWLWYIQQKKMKICTDFCHSFFLLKKRCKHSCSDFFYFFSSSVHYFEGQFLGNTVLLWYLIISIFQVKCKIPFQCRQHLEVIYRCIYIQTWWWWWWCIYKYISMAHVSYNMLVQMRIIPTKWVRIIWHFVNAYHYSLSLAFNHVIPFK